MLYGIQDLVSLFLITTDNDTGLGMFQNVTQFGPRIGWINADAGPAQGLDCEIAEHPFRRIFTGDGDKILRRYAQSQQTIGEIFRVLVIVAIGKTVPDSEILFPKSKSIRIALCPIPQQAGHCCLFGKFYVARHRYFFPR